MTTIDKNVFPVNCPVCGEPLEVEKGKNGDTLKLMCNNKSCDGSSLRRLQKGIKALNIRGIGPEIISKLSACGIKSSFDLFDKNITNPQNLVASGEFKPGKSLDKLLKSIEAVNEIPVGRAILSCQLTDIGETLSEKIGQKLSGTEPDMDGQLIWVRECINDPESELMSTVKFCLGKFEEHGVRVKLNETRKITEVKKVTKRVSVSGTESAELVKSLGWTIVGNGETADLHVCDDKDIVTDDIKSSGVKIMTAKQVKLIF